MKKLLVICLLPLTSAAKDVKLQLGYFHNSYSTDLTMPEFKSYEYKGLKSVVNGLRLGAGYEHTLNEKLAVDGILSVSDRLIAKLETNLIYNVYDRVSLNIGPNLFQELTIGKDNGYDHKLGFGFQVGAKYALSEEFYINSQYEFGYHHYFSNHNTEQKIEHKFQETSQGFSINFGYYFD